VSKTPELDELKKETNLKTSETDDTDDTDITNLVAEKKKFWRGPRKLDEAEMKNARIAYSLCLAGILGFLLQLVYFLFKYSIHDWLAILTYWIVFIMPGYLADAGMLIWGGGKPLDGGRMAKDGRPLFGPGKTIRGFFLGPLLFGIPIALGIHGIIYWQWDAITAAAEAFLADPNVNYDFYDNDPAKLIKDLALYLLGDANGTNDFATFMKLVPRVVLCAFGAAVGDLVGSWAKRRKDVKRGEPFWIVDQIDFLGGCLILAAPFVFSSFNIHVLIMLIVITPSITVVANTLSYFSGHKKHPW
jgi:CDP-2,3-bis-(O-geranylgeranyl)-sn-glycerol synthase